MNRPWARLVAAASIAWALSAAWLAPAAAAQTPGVSDHRPPLGGARAIQAPQTDEAPRIDGQIATGEWAAAAIADDFWISLENRGPSERTQVLVMADADNLYFAFQVFDRRPEAISALQLRRDAEPGLDDRVIVELDPYRSFNSGATSRFSVSARGTQYDEFGGGRARQLSWKGDWKAAAARTAYGWSAEIAIPFEILNYGRGATEFSANFYRYQNRTHELSQWADTTPQSLPEQIGVLTGLKPPLKAARSAWTFLPYLFFGKNVARPSGGVEGASVNGGVDVRYEPRPNLTALVSIQPDLSQIENAVTDIDFSYNEKKIADYRPFFQEGAGYFGGNDAYYFYSKRIPDFEYGARLFGRSGDTQYGTFVASSPGGRWDYLGQADFQIDRTHKVGAAVVISDRSDLDNALLVVSGSGRQASGLNYALEAAGSSTQGAQGDGSYLQGKIGWKEDFWSANLTMDSYTRAFLPADGIVDHDLLDTRGATAAAGVFRDFGSGRFHNIQANAYWQRRYTSDGALQKNYWNVSGSAELRRQIRLTLGYTGGRYRAPGDDAGSWSPAMNRDSYWTAGLELNTRNDRLTYGVTYSDGEIAGGDYSYGAAYLIARPSAATYVQLSAEQLSLYGRYDQFVVAAGWDVTPNQNLSARLIHAYYGDSVRASWSWRIRKNVDLFVLCEDSEQQKTTASIKLVMTLR